MSRQLLRLVGNPCNTRIEPYIEYISLESSAALSAQSRCFPFLGLYYLLFPLFIQRTVPTLATRKVASVKDTRIRLRELRKGRVRGHDFTPIKLDASFALQQCCDSEGKMLRSVTLLTFATQQRRNRYTP